MDLNKTLDDALDALIAPGFSRVGYLVRSRQFSPLASYSLREKTVVITGPTSGLGLAAANQLCAMGADLVLVGRSPERLQKTAKALGEAHPDRRIVTVEADMGDLKAVATASKWIATEMPSVHALIHNAGALLKERAVSAQGHEVTIASHVLGPHLMTTMLLPALRAANGRVITVSSGGMYAATVPNIAGGQSPEMSPESYDGTRQYAIAKRMQVTLNEMWAAREHGVSFAAMHPGWADTPGVQTSLPLFRTVTKPLLRSPDQGADTICWLTADAAMLHDTGKFWCDRSIRAIHKMRRTKSSDTPEARDALWHWCEENTRL